MKREKTRGLSTCLLFVFAAVFAIALAGCGNQAENASGAASEASGSVSENANSSESAEIAVAAKSILSDVDASKQVDLSTLLKDGDDGADKLQDSGIGEGIDDESKAPAGQTFLSSGGLQILIPSTWNFWVDPDGWDFESRDGRLGGYLVSFERQVYATYDVEMLAASIPQALNENGATDLQVVSYGNAYSDLGTLCSTYICCDATISGQAYRYYCEYALSKSYVHCLCLYGTVSDVVANADELGAIIDSLSFNPGEAI